VGSKTSYQRRTIAAQQRGMDAVERKRSEQPAWGGKKKKSARTIRQARPENVVRNSMGCRGQASLRTSGGGQSLVPRPQSCCITKKKQSNGGWGQGKFLCYHRPNATGLIGGEMVKKFFWGDWHSLTRRWKFEIETNAHERSVGEFIRGVKPLKKHW